jgi:lysophospholipase L1-like esterase
MRRALLCACLLLAACSTDPSGAPVGDSSPTEPSTASSVPAEAIDATGASGYQPPALDGLDLESAPVYAALGDSFSSGVGAGPMTYCGRSEDSWVGIAARRDGAVFLNYACGGAGLDDLEVQIEALAPEVDVVGVTMLGNDGGLLRVVRFCLSGECKEEAAAALEVVKDAIPRAESLLRRLADGRRVVFAGYLPSFSTEFLCRFESAAEVSALLVPLQRELLSLQRSMAERLAEEGLDIVFLEPETGHEACSPDPWVHDFSTLLALHPNPAGYRAVAARFPAAP